VGGVLIGDSAVASGQPLSTPLLHAFGPRVVSMCGGISPAVARDDSADGGAAAAVWADIDVDAIEALMRGAIAHNETPGPGGGVVNAQSVLSPGWTSDCGWLLSAAVDAPDELREALLSVAFDSFNAPAAYVCTAELLALYASGTVMHVQRRRCALRCALICLLVRLCTCRSAVLCCAVLCCAVLCCAVRVALQAVRRVRSSMCPVRL
jgi:hypothetical protein